MSSTQTQTQYAFNALFSDPQTLGSFTFAVSQTPDFGDTEAFALRAALMAAFPASRSASVQVSKVEASEISYVTVLSSDPPSFQ